MLRSKTTVLYQYMESHSNGVYIFSALLRICEVKYIENLFDNIVQIANEGRHIYTLRQKLTATQYFPLVFIYEIS